MPFRVTLIKHIKIQCTAETFVIIVLRKKIRPNTSSRSHAKLSATIDLQRKLEQKKKHDEIELGPAINPGLGVALASINLFAIARGKIRDLRCTNNPAPAFELTTSVHTAAAAVAISYRCRGVHYCELGVVGDPRAGRTHHRAGRAGISRIESLFFHDRVI